MNVLTFDTSLDACSAAAARSLQSVTPTIAARFEPMSSGQAERLLPMIAEVLGETGLTVSDLDLIAVTTGPGTFTGTRITIAAARALALINRTPLAAVSSLHLMAMRIAAAAAGASEIAIATDARRDEVYIERFDPDAGRSRGGPSVMGIGEAAESLSGNAVIAGSGGAAVAGAAAALGKTVVPIAPGLLPDARDLLFPAMHLPRLNAVHALYLRPPDAKPQIASLISRT